MNARKFWIIFFVFYILIATAVLNAPPAVKNIKISEPGPGVICEMMQADRSPHCRRMTFVEGMTRR